MAWLTHRVLEPEVMDQADLDPHEHRKALRALARINALSRTEHAYFGPLCDLHQRLGTSRLRILDIASGGGDVAIRLSLRAQETGLDWRISGCDFSPRAVEYARELAMKNDALVHFFVHDVLKKPLVGSFDAIICSLFLHHLDEDQALTLFRQMRQSSDNGVRLILLNDLNRSVIGYGLAQVVGRLLTRSRVVHIDGPRSVRAAFTKSEALQLAEKAGLEGATIRSCWPWRWLLTWSRP